MARKKRDRPAEVPEIPGIPQPDMVGDPENGAPEEEEEVDPRDEADVAMTVKGKSSSVRRAAAQFSAQRGRAPIATEDEDGEAEPEPPVEDAEADRYMELLANPRHMILVRRQFPTRDQWGRRCDFEVGRYPCPIGSLDDLRHEIFGRHGGKRFIVSVHPNTPTGEMKILGAFTITNPETDEPFLPEDDQMAEDYQQGRRPGQAQAAVNPTEKPDNDPMAQVSQSIAKRAQLINQQVAMREAERMLEAAEKKRPGEGTGDDRVAQLEKKIEEQTLEGRMNARMDRLEQIMLAAQKPQGDGQTAILVQMIQSSQAQFAVMMQAMSDQTKAMMAQMIALQKPKEEGGFDAILGRLSKIKEVFSGGAPNERFSRMEDMMCDMLMDRVSGVDDGETDTVKYAIREITPVLKTIAEKAMEGRNTNEMSAEQQKAIREEYARKVAREVAQRFALEQQQQQRALQPAAGAPAPALAGPPPAPAGTPQSTVENQGTSTIVPVQPLQFSAPANATQTQASEEEMETPPRPGTPEYRRNLAVNFVLDTILADVEDRIPWQNPYDSVLVGDILDFLDDELKTQLLPVNTGEQLEAMVAPWADPQKLAAVKEAGKDDVVRSHIRQCIVTAQTEIIRVRKQTAAPMPPAAKAS